MPSILNRPVSSTVPNYFIERLSFRTDIRAHGIRAHKKLLLCQPMRHY